MRYIHCLNNISHYGTDLLDAQKYALTDNVAEASGILVRSAAMHEMEFSPELLAIGRAGAGVNNIPLDRCAEEGIVVFNTPGANANAVKELVLCGLFLGSRDVAGGINWCKENADDENIGKAAEKAKKAFAGREIMGKTLGVIGMGAIGALVANAALGLGMEVIGYDPFLSPAAALRIDPRVRFTADLDEVLRAGDYLTIHVPSLPATKGMIDERACSIMKDGVVFLNFSRDNLVNDEAMAAALEAGKVHAYITDFANPAVMKMKGAVVIPHLGASTAEAEDNCAVMATRELVDFIDNGNITNSVNYPALNAGAAPAEGARVCVLFAAADDALANITAALPGATATASAVRGANGYAVIDVPAADEAAVAAVAALEGVRRVRVIA